MQHVMYREWEKRLSPMINSFAHRLSLRLRYEGVGFDDAQQELRLALFQALASYDAERSHGGMYNYAREVLKNAACHVMCRASRKARRPHIVVEEDGELKTKAISNIYMDDLVLDAFEDRGLSVEDQAEENRFRTRLRAARGKLARDLNDREREVFACFVNPSEEFLIYLENEGAIEPSNELIAKFLGRSKNSVDWAIHTIKKKFTKILEQDFSDVIEIPVREGKWPLLFVSKKYSDREFVRDVMQERRLDTRPLRPREILANHRKGAYRSVERYSWGSVIEVSFGEEHATVLAVGRFNPLSGEVIGEGGYWKRLQDCIPWYSMVISALR